MQCIFFTMTVPNDHEFIQSIQGSLASLLVMNFSEPFLQQFPFPTHLWSSSINCLLLPKAAIPFIYPKLIFFKAMVALPIACQHLLPLSWSVLSRLRCPGSIYAWTIVKLTCFWKDTSIYSQKTDLKYISNHILWDIVCFSQFSRLYLILAVS